MTQTLLREQLGFRGLTITDALDMKGVSAHFPVGEIHTRALLAGNDILLFCVDVPAAIGAIEEAVAAGQIDQAEIDARCRRQLAAKARLVDRLLPDEAGLPAALFTPQTQALQQQLAAAALTLLRNDAQVLPLRPGVRIATLACQIGNQGTDARAHHQLTGGQYAQAGGQTRFQEMLPGVAHYSLHAGCTADELAAVEAALAQADVWLLCVHGLGIKAHDQFGIGAADVALLDRLAMLQPALLLFGNPYALRRLGQVAALPTQVLLYQDSPETQAAAAAFVLGQAGASGRLPVRL
ncbi:MAG: hypothetical protein OHK0039_44840 [Bacteroidia bacterium]